MEEEKLDTDILGLDLKYDLRKGVISLDMRSYLTKLEEEYKNVIGDYGKIGKVPHVTSYKIHPKEQVFEIDKTEYKRKVKYLQELIGKLNYVRSRGRLDIEFAVRKSCQLVLYPHPKVIEATEKITRYLFGTKTLGMTFKRDVNKALNITVVSDASWNTEFDLKSRAGAAIWLENNFFYGFSKKSTIVCDSSAESELDALNMAEKIALFLKFKLEKICPNKKRKITLITDSAPALGWLKQDYYKPHTKFIGLRVERLKERVDDPKPIISNTPP
ncbi:Ty1/Copia family ribonuclease HI KNAG_0M01670 [Huiozyma naganishii CBS 8797]|uniref:Uncharacterized protein n=1 Tax=Huiozyma naganishii (strain ATCC MYA-139 / BCRC 22969 / CBS 8797 / KCTC 17520 / NBRC 10181 / NCYC 3082 / Yp74L-3) TaxID=1071383 RepID=J7RDV9_HUIN7|nr:hypothetical protein KNAG_0M01670 [Kazachstania naganishii CBS 8797]CCK73020.1 hypothetical protein KNAG_0M01670 [Kazachstania naganishii CBS 8797]